MGWQIATLLKICKQILCMWRKVESSCLIVGVVGDVCREDARVVQINFVSGRIPLGWRRRVVCPPIAVFWVLGSPPRFWFLGRVPKKGQFFGIWDPPPRLFPPLFDGEVFVFRWRFQNNVFGHFGVSWRVRIPPTTPWFTNPEEACGILGLMGVASNKIWEFLLQKKPEKFTAPYHCLNLSTKNPHFDIHVIHVFAPQKTVWNKYPHQTQKR